MGAEVCAEDAEDVDPSGQDDPHGGQLRAQDGGAVLLDSPRGRSLWEDEEGLGLKVGQGKQKSDRPKKKPQSAKRCQKRGRGAQRSSVGLLGLLVTYLLPAND